MTEIDYCSRFLPAACLTPGYSAMAAVEVLVIAGPRRSESTDRWKGGGDPATPRVVHDGTVRAQLPRRQARAREAKAKLDALRERPAA